LISNLIIVNPYSGNGKAKKSHEIINNWLTAHPEIEKVTNLFYSNTLQETIDLISNISDSVKKIIIVGGDGSLNQFINHTPNFEQFMIGIIPSGSGNDFIKNFNLPKKIDDQLELYLNSEPKLLFSDILEASFSVGEKLAFSNYIINSMGIGFDGLVAYHKNKSNIDNGILSYIVSVFSSLKERKSYSANILHSNSTSTNCESLLLICIGNGISSGGGFYLTPNALITDGFFDISVIQDISTLKLLKSLPLALINKVVGIPEVSFFKEKETEINLLEKTHVHIDGELVTGYFDRIHIKLAEKKLKLMVL
jgi:YegS/Rv2252/BmrU family lipid kinase